jgi:hypothetical protein
MVEKIVLMLALIVLGFASMVSAHLPIEVLYCPAFQYVGATHIPKMLTTKVTENGLYAELYDVTGDNKVDIVTYSALDGGIFDKDKGEPLHKDMPIFYEVDDDGDQEADALYIDARGEQRCEDIILYAEDSARGGSLVSWGTLAF